MNKTSYIYTLTDPRTNEVHYVGKTIRPKLRSYQNCSTVFYGRRVAAWAREVRASGYSPLFEIIEECERADGLRREKSWIDYHIENGSPLLNHFGVRVKFRIGGAGNGAG